MAQQIAAEGADSFVVERRRRRAKEEKEASE
jgi:hypothetical protein